MIQSPFPEIESTNYLDGKKSIEPHDFLFWRKIDQKAYAMRSGTSKEMKVNGERQLYNLGQDVKETYNIDECQLNHANDKWKSYQECENKLKDPVFLGLRQNEDYVAVNPNRFVKKISSKEVEIKKVRNL
jgi:hypothetical protein